MFGFGKKKVEFIDICSQKAGEEKKIIRVVQWKGKQVTLPFCKLCASGCDEEWKVAHARHPPSCPCECHKIQSD